MPKVILVTGSRKHPHPELVGNTLAVRKPDIVIHGNSGEIDNAASWFCRQNPVIEVSCPYPSLLGRAGGPKRNQVMCQIASMCLQQGHKVYVLAFPLDDGSSRGTRNCMLAAENLDIPVVKVSEIGDVCRWWSG